MQDDGGGTTWVLMVQEKPDQHFEFWRVLQDSGYWVI